MEQQLNQVEQQMAQLVITAPVTGRLISRAIHNSLGKLVKVGQPFAEIAAVEGLEIHCSIAQADADVYRKHIGDKAKIDLTGNPKLMGTLTDVRPRGSDSLSNPCLAAKFGGPIAVQMTNTVTDKQNPLKTIDPRFEARLSIDPSVAESLVPGQLCRVGLVNRQMSIAGMLDRWKNAFIEWMKPEESKS